MNSIEDVLLIGLIVVAILAIPTAIAAIASRKGYSGIGFFLFGLLCTLPAIIVIMVLPDRATGERYTMGSR